MAFTQMQQSELQGCWRIVYRVMLACMGDGSGDDLLVAVIAVRNISTYHADQAPQNNKGHGTSWQP